VLAGPAGASRSPPQPPATSSGRRVAVQRGREKLAPWLRQGLSPPRACVIPGLAPGLQEEVRSLGFP